MADSDTLRLQFEGVDPIHKALARAVTRFPKQAKQAMHEVSELTLGDVQEHFIPVKEDELRATGEALPATIHGDRVEGHIQFGGTAAPYAVALHEHESEASPPTWRGKTLKFTKAGTGTKYLEKAIMLRQETLAADLGRRINLARLLR
jgi:hypothetical protein